MGSESIKQEVLMTRQIYSEEINQFGKFPDFKSYLFVDKIKD